MKVIFDRDELLSALIPASGVVPGRNTSANVDGILFECPGDENRHMQPERIRSRKGYAHHDRRENSFRRQVHTEYSEDTSDRQIVPRGRAYDLGRRESESDNLLRKRSFEISALPGEEFPYLPNLNGDRNYVMPQYELRAIITRTVVRRYSERSAPCVPTAFTSI